MVCNIRFGNVIIADEDSNKSEKIRELRDTMATLRWELWEENGILHRSEISIEKLKKEMFAAIEEYPPIDWEYEQSTIFQPVVSVEEAFAHFEELIPKKENAFLFRR